MYFRYKCRSRVITLLFVNITQDRLVTDSVVLVPCRCSTVDSTVQYESRNAECSHCSVFLCLDFSRLPIPLPEWVGE